MVGGGAEAEVGRAPLIECRGVGKTFRTSRRGAGLAGIFRQFVRRRVEEVVALSRVDLAIFPGELVGLIGRNGAGKTTLVKCLTGIVPVSRGSATLFGRDSFRLRDEHKRRLAVVMGQRSQLFWDVPALDSFRLLRAIYGVPADAFRERLDRYADMLEVADRLEVPFRHLSLGQRMKMEIIGAFLHDPEVVFLDEPTIGLDLVSQETIRQFLRDRNRDRGVTLVLTSHDMVDIEQTCSRLVILDEGAVLFDGDLVDLKRRLSGTRSVEVHLEPGAPGLAPEAARELDGLGATLVLDAAGRLSFEVPAGNTQAFVQRLLALLPVRDLTIEGQPLERLIREIFRSGEVRKS